MSPNAFLIFSEFEIFNGNVSMFSIGVEITPEVLPQPNKIEAAIAESRRGLKLNVIVFK